jgi:dihydroorotase
VTPQHLIYTIGHLLQGLKYHLYCLPLLKFAEDRDALRHAVTSTNNTKFFAGTDSAAHTKKATACGCAAGCFTGGVAPQLYAQAFELAGLDLSTAQNQTIFEAFLCTNGPAFYGLKPSRETFTLTKTPQKVSLLETSDGPITPLPIGMGEETVFWSLAMD